ncbi:Emopamil-binding protein [Ceraceosorus guamensis]|uniref:Emopamil-binding protein n=1 Tax=Ceraceosorus guamensis TaxID=1522189 RepID=A0A316VV44_9BASI|nr:Emopamil-binding protein [Ceraceosorus guamensis]PWN41340.1 Emopamil-binding protein [Ceraceosorus guamensis]
MDEQTKQSLLANGFVALLVTGGFLSSQLLLPKRASRKTRFIFTWLAFDALCHSIIEGSFLYYSTFGRSINTSQGFLAYLWKDYARADKRWGWSDPTVVSLEILTVLGAGPLAAYCCYLLLNDVAAYHYWAVVLSTAELYGGFMTFCPEWLTQNKNLDASDWMLFYVYLCFMNLAWVFIPFYLLLDSYGSITAGLRTVAGATAAVTKTQKSK